jgi:hypothetical protein
MLLERIQETTQGTETRDKEERTMSWTHQALKRAGSNEAQYAIMAKVTAAINGRSCGETTVYHEGQVYRVSWSRLVCPSIW